MFNNVLEFLNSDSLKSDLVFTSGIRLKKI